MSRYNEGVQTHDARTHVPRFTIPGLDLPPWMSHALCAQIDNDIFFPDKGGSTREAKSICAVCPVAAECLDYALTHQERFGIWGGTSEGERRKIAAALHIPPASPTEQLPEEESA